MKKLLLLLIVVGGLCQGWQKLVKSDGTLAYTPGSPYVIVYGRDSCGWTNQMRKQLAQEGIRFGYQVVDDRSVADGLHQKMESVGLSTRRYNLPVVEVNGKVLIRPDLETVAGIYR